MSGFIQLRTVPKFSLAQGVLLAFQPFQVSLFNFYSQMETLPYLLIAVIEFDL